MGDIIETTTDAFQPFLYYKTSGSSIWFDIKTHSSALVGLGKVCGRNDYSLEFCNPGNITISQKNQVRKRKTDLPFTLSEDKYTKFWIAWDCESVRAGIGPSLDAVISWSISSHLNYITFTTKDPIHPCSFIFEVPPLCLRIPPVPSEPKITAGELKWIQCNDQLPDEAVIGGHIDGEIVYVVRAHHRRSLTPGVFVPSKGLAFIPWGGSDNPTTDFEALCGFDLKWVAASDNQIPVDAFVAGYSEVRREPLYICRGSLNGDIIPGKVQMSHATCYIAEGGREITVRKFEVLTQPGLNVHCANKYLRPRNDSLEFDFDEYEDAEEEDDGDVVLVF